MKHKLTITGKQGQESILLDDKPIHVNKLVLTMECGKVNSVTLTMSNIEVDLDIETELH